MNLELKPKITVIGVGGAGGNAVNNMIRAKLEGVEFIVANTDAQALSQALVAQDKRIQLGLNVTQGLGAGSKPDVGRSAAEESTEEILNLVKGSNMVFITAGMGGGTGTGAAPVIARTARESGILTVGVVTRPFHFEGTHRTRTAERGIEEMQQYVDTLIVIPNQNLFRIASEKTTFADAFKLADDVLYSGVRGVTDLMIMPGLINLDFADIRAVMGEMGKAMMGTGEAQGDRRALDAAEAAISNPLLDDVSMNGAKGVLINITGGYDMTLYEVDEAANRIRDEVDPEANIIFGSTFDEKLNGMMRVSVVATGIGGSYRASTSGITLPAAASVAKQEVVTPTIDFTPRDFGFTPISLHPKDLTAPLPPVSSQEQALPAEANFTAAAVPTSAATSASLESSLPEDEKEALQKPIMDLMHSPEEEKAPSQNLSALSPSKVILEARKTTTEPNISAGVPRRKPTSLFERFTGVGRQKTPSLLEETTKTSASTVSPPPPLKEEDTELLEIPAFLRRNN